jgi:hypothetical protein
MEKKIMSNILITSQNFSKKSPIIDEENENIESKTIPDTNLSFPKIRYKTVDKKEEKLNIIPFILSKNEKIFLRNMKKFIEHDNRTKIETYRLKNIKKSLVLKRFKELHKYKLEINPKNYYHNYGLNNYIIITNKKKNRSRNIDYKFNNISSYNNIFKAQEEDKSTKIESKSKKRKDLSLKSLPYRLNRARNDNGILKFSNNGTITDENSIWRGKNINEMIHTSIDFDYLNLFKKNYKSMGKIKFIK